MINKIALSIIVFFSFSLTAYEFNGVHYMASYKQCDDDRINDSTWLYSYFLEGIYESGATILAHHMEKFEPVGMTATCILSESHASIHTYPEHNSVFVDLFTCGDGCDWQKFEAVLVDWLKPAVIERTVMVRE